MRVVLGAVILLWPLAVAWAEPMTVDVFTTSRYSDNIDRVGTNKQEDFEHQFGIGISKSTRPDVCQGTLNGDFAFVTYQRDTNDDEIIGTADADGVCEPNRNFKWSARNTLRNERTNTRAPNAPSNREQRNLFSTGPTFTIRPSSVDNLSLAVEYQMSRFEESTEDNSDRVTTTGRWLHLFSPNLDGGLAASHSVIDYRRTGEDLTRDNANLFFNWRRANGEWNVEAGYSWLESEQGAFRNESQGFTGLLRYSHQWETGTTGFAEVRRTLTDVSDEVDIQIPDLDLNLTETAAVTVTAVTAGLGQQWTERTESDMSVSLTESDYERSAETEQRFNADVGISHRFGQNLSGRAGAGYSREDFGDEVIDTVGGELGLDYQRTRDLNLTMSLGHDLRRSDAGGTGNEYDENWIQVGIRYNLR